ncbi:MAG: hypothetical protein IPK95_07060 [Cellvibrionales bacterium]|nr:hypothetical protein [Cellvibrionales bacterium]
MWIEQPYGNEKVLLCKILPGRGHHQGANGSQRQQQPEIIVITGIGLMQIVICINGRKLLDWIRHCLYRFYQHYNAHQVNVWVRYWQPVASHRITLGSVLNGFSLLKSCPDESNTRNSHQPEVTMQLSFTPEQEALRKQLRAYFKDLMTPALEAELGHDFKHEGGGPLAESGHA